VTTYQNGFSALSDPTRREIFERLARRPRPVGELAEGLPVSRPAVSQHLKVLREAGLVIDTRVGSRRLYRVDPKGVEGMRLYLDRFWSDALAAFEDAARAKEDR
jgi:DNA-binding transcriptional ArsR family regulator